MNKMIDQLNLKDGQGYLVTNESNVTYLSGFTGEAAWLILSKSGNVLMTDGRYDEQARRECKDFKVTKWLNNKRFSPETICHYLAEYDISHLYYNGKNLTVDQLKALESYLIEENTKIELTSSPGVVESLRAIKNAKEIEYIKKACAIADKALDETLSIIKAGVSELEIVATLEYHMKMNGAENISFDTIVLSGKKTSLPHGKPSDKKLEIGDFLQLDFGALYKGYHSDMSRTFIIGQASEEQIKIYQIMQEATRVGIQALADNIPGYIPDQKVRECLGEYEEYYYPGLGHGVGLDVHELPFMSQTTKDNLSIGQVVTIEPGVYIPDFGGMRIEDTVVITKDGVEILTKFPRDLQILK